MTYKEKIKHRKKIRAIATQAGRVREACRILSTFSVLDLYDLCHPDPEKAVRDTLIDFKKAGEVRRIEKGVYTYVGRAEKRHFTDVIWHLVRSYRAFTTDDIERLSGARRYTVLEYLRFLGSAGILEKTGRGNWRLVKDPGPATPENMRKREKLSRVRAKIQGSRGRGFK
ncbi:MAG: hypothetical protein JRJ54_14610 [Deltaproteobacteria bacterium]|nr:hypothetical protein [Deltaproteobacteria bacterium]